MINIPPEQERIIAEYMQQGGFQTPQEVLDAALGALGQTLKHTIADTLQRQKMASEAAQSIRKNRIGNSLGGLKIKDLINEGRP